MAISPEQIQIAQDRQELAAHDNRPHVRLVAGPGTGKSFAIQERVKWLLEQGVSPDSIFVVSFTRASSKDLRTRIERFCQAEGCEGSEQINVSTLHSLALRALRLANLLTYPAEPLVLSDWEQDTIFDKEFSKSSGYSPNGVGGYTPGRGKKIRLDYEAFCGAGEWQPPNYIPPNPPISEEERNNYRMFHIPRTQVYSCVLPGEIIRKCVVDMEANVLDPSSLLNIQYLIVDEYQDLNPTDLEFVDRLISSGVTTFVTGDDDQSIYSFRYASPEGIQTFLQRFPEAGDHELRECFRCSASVLQAAQTLLDNFPEPRRIPKGLTSLYENSTPPISGIVHRWKFPSFQAEARAIAKSCSLLIANNIPKDEILILLSNKRAMLTTVVSELEAENIEFEAPREDTYYDTKPGRFVQALIRIVCNQDDYIAHRLILGLRPGVGVSTCNGIAEKVISHNLNYRGVFYHPIPTGVFSGRELTAIERVREICARISEWSSEETLKDRKEAVLGIITSIFGEEESQAWNEDVSNLPEGITLLELNNFLQADTDEKKRELLEVVFNRLDITVPEEGIIPLKVRVMTMHGSKGLDAQVVFIPGLVDEILPGRLKQPFPGLVLEAARMLYVSITRARAACILTFSSTRIENGTFAGQTRSRFVPHLGGAFHNRTEGLSKEEAQEIFDEINDM